MRNLLLFLLLLSGPCAAAGPVALSAAQRAALQIETAPVSAVSGNLGSLLPARVTIPNAQLQVVTAAQQGLVERLLVAAGESVTAGQPLASIQSPRFLELQSEYLELLTRERLAAANYRRDRQLSKEGIIAERRLLESRAAWQELDTDLERMRRTLALAGMDEPALAALAAKRELDSTLLVRAPFDGVILEQLVEAGARVEAADPLYRVAQLDPLWLEIHVPLDRLGESRTGQPVVIPALGITGRIITIGQLVHGTDQGVLLRAEVHAGSEQLRPGQFVQARLAVDAPGERFRVPAPAVTHVQGTSYVFVDRAQGFEAVAVQVIEEENGSLVIAAELAGDARVAVRGVAALKSAWLQGGE